MRKATQNNNTDLEEKIIQKMENALALREEQLEKIKEKIREHVRSFTNFKLNQDHETDLYYF